MNDRIDGQVPLCQENSQNTYAHAIQGLLDVARTIHQQLQIVAKKLEPHLRALAQIDWNSVKKKIDELPTKSKNTMRLALAQGWFFGWHDGLESLMQLIVELEEAQPDDIDEIMTRYYRINFHSFADELAQSYPNRAAAINAAIRAHTSLGDEGYLLSIPVFIAQADGLLAEITEIESPMTHAAVALRERYADDVELLDLLYPFLELRHSHFLMTSKTRAKHEIDSGEPFTALNRHQVMHGECSDYGTEINSLKAFSLLAFVGLHMPTVLEGSESRQA